MGQTSAASPMLERTGYAVFLILGLLVIPLLLAAGFVALAQFIAWLVRRYQRFTVRHLLVLTGLVAIVTWIVAALFSTL